MQRCPVVRHQGKSRPCAHLPVSSSRTGRSHLMHERTFRSAQFREPGLLDLSVGRASRGWAANVSCRFVQTSNQTLVLLLRTRNCWRWRHLQHLATGRICRGWTSRRELRSTPSRRGVGQDDTPLRFRKISSCWRAIQPLLSRHGRHLSIFLSSGRSRSDEKCRFCLIR